MPMNDAVPPDDAHPTPREPDLLGALERERWRGRLLQALLVLALAAAGTMAALWRGAVAVGGRMEERTRSAEHALAEAERLAVEHGRATEEQAEKARADVQAALYAQAIQRAQQAWGDRDARGARELLEGIQAEARGWEWRHLSRPLDASPAGKE